MTLSTDAVTSSTIPETTFKNSMVKRVFEILGKIGSVALRILGGLAIFALIAVAGVGPIVGVGGLILGVINLSTTHLIVGAVALVATLISVVVLTTLALSSPKSFMPSN